MGLFIFPLTPVSITSGATEAKQDVIITELQDIETDVETTNTTLTSINTKLDTANSSLLSLDGKDFATSAKQDSIITELQDIEADAEAISSTLTSLNNKLAASLVPEAYDYLELTYVTVGNGIGEIETVVYKTGGSSGTTVTTLTLAYDGSNNLSSVTKS